MTGEALSKSIYEFLIENKIDQKLKEKAKQIEKQKQIVLNPNKLKININHNNQLLSYNTHPFSLILLF